VRYEDKTLEFRHFLKTNLPGHEALVDYVLLNPKFMLWSGCSHKDRHHYGIGGLQYHTWEVVHLCNVNAYTMDIICKGKKEINKVVLLLAALYHDVGKMWDYVPVKPSRPSEDSPVREVDFQGLQDYARNGAADFIQWKGASHKRTIHHISRSGVEWTKAVTQTGVGKEIEDEVLHCILSHHGQREWGSPVAPKSREAWMLFLCDGISARMNDADSFDMKGQVKNV